MATKQDNLRDPGSCLNKASADEPIFVLRGNDPLAAQTVRLWAEMAVGHRDAEKIEDALRVADDLRDWYMAHNPRDGMCLESSRDPRTRTI